MSEKLSNPWPKLPEEDAEWLHAKVPKDVFNNFFRGTMSGEHGCRQTILNILFHKFYEQCIQEKVPFVWDINNESRLVAILANLNFNSAANAKPTVDSRPQRSVRTGRPNPRTAKSAAQPSVGDSDT